MMTGWLTWIAIGSLLALVAMQTAYVFLYRRFLNRRLPVVDSSESCFSGHDPSVAVVLCLRGRDPSLQDCLLGLGTLDYPSYQLHLVVDAASDPALVAARGFFERTNSNCDVIYHVMEDHAASRSLKCSALITAVLALTDSIEVVALVDADASVSPDWLTRLVAPLHDATIGASTGNRWFAPDDVMLGSHVRKIWNAAALPQMSLYRIAWGGSLAIRKNVIDECQLLDHWSTAFCEDTMMAGVLGQHELRVERIPDLVIVNRESSSLKDAFRWIDRQLLTVRLYHSRWPWILGHALMSAFCMFVPPLVVIFHLVRFDWGSALMVAGSWLAFQLVNMALVQWIEFGNRKVLLDGNTTDQTVVFDDAICTSVVGAAANFMLQLIYPFLALSAAFQQRVTWRGIHYRIRSKGRIEMVEYHPFQKAETKVGDRKSIH